MNISISSITNQSVDSSAISVRSMLSCGKDNKNSLFDNTFKSTKLTTQSKSIMDDIITNNNQINQLKEQLYNKIYDICLNQIQNSYKTQSFIIFEIPKSYMDGNYNWKECYKFIVNNLRNSGYDLKKKDNFIKISWAKFNKKFQD